MKEYYQIYENIISTEELVVNDNLSEEVVHLIKSKNYYNYYNRLVDKGQI